MSDEENVQVMLDIINQVRNEPSSSLSPSSSSSSSSSVPSLRSMFDLKFIHSSMRSPGISFGQIEKAMRRALALRKTHPQFLAGFDLVGEEDLGNTARVRLQTPALALLSVRPTSLHVRRLPIVFSRIVCSFTRMSVCMCVCGLLVFVVFCPLFPQSLRAPRARVRH